MEQENRFPFGSFKSWFHFILIVVIINMMATRCVWLHILSKWSHCKSNSSTACTLCTAHVCLWRCKSHINIWIFCKISSWKSQQKQQLAILIFPKAINNKILVKCTHFDEEKAIASIYCVFSLRKCQRNCKRHNRIKRKTHQFRLLPKFKSVRSIWIGHRTNCVFFNIFVFI